MPTRNVLIASLMLLTAALLTATLAGALEKPTYETLAEDGDIELRRYEPYLVAETTVTGEYGQAMNQAFMRLFRYISGKNRKQIEPEAPAIAMTAPVTMARVDEGWRMAFMVPGKYTLETAPAPADPAVRLREERGGLVAALRYSGTRGRERFLARQAQLEAWLAERGLEAAGPSLYAGYDAPYVPWFLRRNEVLIPVKAETEAGAASRSAG